MYFALSFNGPGPTSVPLIGDVALSPPIRIIPADPTNSYGIGNLAISILPNVAGVSVWAQALDPRSRSLSTPLALVVW
jgi:hypothetical protein